MKLTIGMIVKNEEKWLEKCLTAIKPILDNVDSELIITDTGSTDRTVEIAKKFTDKVLHFDWIGDFAAARNTAVDIAQGEWLMFLDADEIFRSCENIIRFFNSGEYKNYNSATFVIHNITRDEMSSNSFRAQRFTKIKKNTKFEGVIHELLNTYGSPIRHLGDVADHYGYVYASKEEAEKKSRRNAELLLKKLELEKQPEGIIYVQLYDSFTTGNDKDNADKYMQLGIDYCRKRKDLALAILYVKKAFAEASEDRYSDAIKTCTDFLNMDKSIRPDRLTSDREIYAILATSCLRTGNIADAETMFIKFFDAYEDVENGTLDTPESDGISFRASAEFNFIPFVNAFIACCKGNGHEKTAAETLKKIPIYKHSQNTDGLKSVIAAEAELLEKCGLDYLESFCSQLDENGKRELRQAAEKLQKRAVPQMSPEMRQLSAMLKSNVKKLIVNGDFASAKKYLDEYVKMVPNDPEAQQLLDMIKG